MNYNQPHPEARRLFFHDTTLGNIGTQFCRPLGFILIKIIQSAVSAVDLRVDGVMWKSTFLLLHSWQEVLSQSVGFSSFAAASLEQMFSFTLLYFQPHLRLLWRDANFHSNINKSWSVSLVHASIMQKPVASAFRSSQTSDDGLARFAFSDVLDFGLGRRWFRDLQ